MNKSYWTLFLLIYSLFGSALGNNFALLQDTVYIYDTIFVYDTVYIEHTIYDTLTIPPDPLAQSLSKFAEKFNLKALIGPTYFWITDGEKNVSNPITPGFTIGFTLEREFKQWALSIGANYLYNHNDKRATITTDTPSSQDINYHDALNNEQPWVSYNHHLQRNFIDNGNDLLTYHNQLDVPLSIELKGRILSAGLGLHFRTKFYNKESVFVDFINDIGISPRVNYHITSNIALSLSYYYGLTNEDFYNTDTGVYSRSANLGFVYQFF